MAIAIKKLDNANDRLEAERIIATTFLQDWDEKEARSRAESPEGDVWAAFDESGRMTTAIMTLRHEMTYEGRVISCPEFHTVGTLAEARGGGAVRELIGAILREAKANGDLFATLIPFSFAFYRKFGFEQASEMVVNKADISQFSGFRQELTAKQIFSQEDVDDARRLYDDLAINYNLADLRTDNDWTYRGNGEFGKRNWMHADKTHYSYLFSDRNGAVKAYFTFVFVPGPNGPFTGTLHVLDMIFDSPEALRSVFGFFYGMRAKITDVSVELPGDVDLSLILPESGSVIRTIDSHYTARILNVEKVLSAMRQPKGDGVYSIRVTDGFLTENSGTYTVSFRDGETTGVTKGDGAADLELTGETLCQLTVGRTGLNGALYREGTVLRSNRPVLERVFVKKPVLLR